MDNIEIDDYNEDKFDDLDDSDTLKPENIGTADGVYPDANIKIDRDQYSVFELKRRFDKKTIVLDPDFQREFVWSPKQKSELIESVLMGIPLPLIYLVEREDGKLAVVDGRQRLTTFFDFLDGKFRLSELRILKDISNKKFNELDGKYQKFQSDFEDFQLIVQTIKPPTPDRIKFDIFDRVNRGGTNLNNQEMRNALYLGRSTRLLNRLAKRREFLDATGNSVKPKRMKDKYIILRFLAFYLLKSGTLKDKNNMEIDYKSDMEDLLGKTMEYLNTIDDKTEKDLEEIFIFSMKNAFLIFGENAFRIPSNASIRRPVSMTLFECLSYFFSKDNWIIYKDKIKVKVKELFNDSDFKKSLTSSVDSSAMVKKRFEYMDKLIEEVKNDN